MTSSKIMKAAHIVPIHVPYQVTDFLVLVVEQVFSSGFSTSGERVSWALAFTTARVLRRKKKQFCHTSYDVSLLQSRNVI